MKIAMWSGPRNLSTAMMYAFGNRSDFAAVDEPFYAAYLAQTGLAHPMREHIIASQSTDPANVVQGLLGPNPHHAPHVYHKHMAQHMIEGVPRDWLGKVANVFLIRHPARVVASFAAKYENPTLDDIGFVQQAELFDEITAIGHQPLVLDSADIRDNPEGMLRKLCAELGLSFDPAMLEWPAGAKPFDGVWAPVWYGAVHESVGFAGPEGPLPEVTGRLAALVEAALPAYEKMRRYAL
ncbi:HAD family hydrolase [Primorskyibacter marinus]|uniref:sulfotransferase-like domain-containing protein n=1 Tax=Primorskyibacter marinus TaxID=1977320 RepID=UPI000E307A94|nr:HAD family hydrolase [Primorskyibacter marinus]